MYRIRFVRYSSDGTIFAGEWSLLILSPMRSLSAKRETPIYHWHESCSNVSTRVFRIATMTRHFCHAKTSYDYTLLTTIYKYTITMDIQTFHCDNSKSTLIQKRTFTG